MSVPEISVLMPVYNAEKYLKQAIESIIEQTFNDFEFIIINDGSTDTSLSIIEGYASRDQRIKLVSRENKGLVYTLNEGLGLSRGKYIARMDADDISFVYRFQKQYEFLQINDEYAVVGSKVELIDDEGMPLIEMIDIYEHNDIDEAHINCLLGGAVIMHPTALIRKASILAVGGYDERFKHAEDYDLWLRLAEIGKLHNLNEVLLSYRQHLESIGYANREGQLLSTYNSIESACIRRNIKNKTFNNITIDDELSTFDTFIKWGWWALKNKNLSTARKYSKKSFLLRPLNIDSWKLILCSIRGY
jgi:glycosyltransferase involved in cell wall biosynthesis